MGRVSERLEGATEGEVMKVKMWSLINTTKNKIIKIYSGGSYVVGFDTKRDLIEAIKVDGQYHIESNEEVMKIQLEKD